MIESDAENERLIVEMERIDMLPNPSPEEKELSELIGLLVETYERRYDLGRAEPIEALKQLMEDRGIRQRDLIPVFGSSSVASDVLNGKREISKRHARALAEFFAVPVGSIFNRMPASKWRVRPSFYGKLEQEREMRDFIRKATESVRRLLNPEKMDPPEDPYSGVRAPVKPRPRDRSGAITLEEPEP